MRNKMQYVSQKRRLFRLQPRYFFSSRKIKDRLFCYIFEHDRSALLDLYNALNHTDYQDEQMLQVVTLDNAVYMSMKNDMAFLLIGTLNLYEHQSTLCPNLPLRFLLYIAAEYEGLMAGMDANIYGSSLVRLPAPQCVVFYNGDDAAEDEQYLRLTDAFVNEQGKKTASCIELSVRVLNINHGYNRQLMSCCRRLEEYSRFVDCIKRNCRDGFTTEQAVENAIVYCIEHDILGDILLPFRAEVKKMLLTEYNEKKYMKLFRKEAREEGLAEGRAEGLLQGLKEGREAGKREGRKEGAEEERNRLLCIMLQNGASAEQISKLTGLPLSEIEAVRQGTKKQCEQAAKQ